MAKKQSNPVIQALVKSLLLAATFILLGVLWTDTSSLVRVSAVLAGLAFAIEGIITYNKQNKSNPK